MGNMCVGSSSTAVYESGHHSGHSEDTRLGDLNNSLGNLMNSRGLTQNQHSYMTNEAPSELRRLHDSLVRETGHAENLARMEQSRLSGDGFISSGIRPEEHVSILDNLTSRWDSMRDTIQTALDANLSNNRGHVVQNPSGSMRWGNFSEY